MRRFHFAVFARLALLVLAAQPLVAATATYYVGTCRIAAFGTISAAVAAVPSGSIIDVCPGTYAEQVIISQPLTLQGIFAGNSSEVVITMPSGGLATTSSILFGTIAAQIEVTAGPVNISSLTVDGAASSNCPAGNYSGIFYGSGSSGQVNEAETRNQSCNASGFGIVAENTAGTAQSITIENSNVHDNTEAGITACSDQTPSTLTATIKNNYVASNLPSSLFGIWPSCNVAGTTSGNKIVGGFAGINAASASNLVSGNTVTAASIGIELLASTTVSKNTVLNATFAGILVEEPGTVSSNGIWNSSNYGILLNVGPVQSATVKTNTLTSSFIGIEFQCSNAANTVIGNTLNGAVTGTDQVPATFTGANKFNNVVTVRTGC